MPNPYCDALRIAVPLLARVKDHHEASTYSLLIVALLEHGGPMTLGEVADRFDEALIQPAPFALRSLKKCKPARAPVYRVGDRYELDVHDDELDLWLFRLGLRPPKVPRLAVVPGPSPPRPGPEVPLTTAEVEEALRHDQGYCFSDQRLALAVLDAHGGTMAATDVVREVHRLTSREQFDVERARLWRSNAILLHDDGTWSINREHPAHVAARSAVRDRVEANRKRAARRGALGPHDAVLRRVEEEQARRAGKLAAMRRVLLVVFPPEAPEAATVVDVATREVTTFVGAEMDRLPGVLSSYDFVGGLGVRGMLRALGVDPTGRVVAELGPPQKSYQLNRRGRTLKVTAALLAQGSCGISKPFRDPRDLRRHLDAGAESRLRRAMEADAKSLFALYSYGRVHGAYRLRWGFVDDMLPVPWVRRDEPRIHGFLRAACERGDIVEAVIGRAAAWSDPWGRAVRCRVVPGRHEWDHTLVDAEGWTVDVRDVQQIRVMGAETEP